MRRGALLIAAVLVVTLTGPSSSTVPSGRDPATLGRAPDPPRHLMMASYSAPAEEGIIQSALVWTRGTMIANAYGTQCYGFTFRWPVKPASSTVVVAHPGIGVKVCARALDRKVLAGASWWCGSIDVNGVTAWDETAPCQAWFTPAGYPTRTIDADFDYLHPRGVPQDIDLHVKVDYLGNAAGNWERRAG